MTRFSLIALALAPILAACGGGGDTTLFPIPPAPEPSTAIGSVDLGTDGGTAGNDISFAGEGTTLAGLNGETDLLVRVLRTRTDWDTGQTELLISEETLDIVNLANADFALTLDDAVLFFESGNGPSTPNFDDWTASVQEGGEVSTIVSFASYAFAPLDGIEGEFDSEAFFVVGAETDPSELVASLGNAVVYQGSASGFGQVLNEGNHVIGSQQAWSADVTMTADFTNDLIGGTLLLSIVPSEFGDDSTETIDATGTFASAITGNSYGGDLTVTCATCTDNGSVIGGAFFGADGLETSGLVGLDVTAADVLGNEDVRFIAAGGFTAGQE